MVVMSSTQLPEKSVWFNGLTAGAIIEGDIKMDRQESPVSLVKI